ncbi:hypothetical protein GJ744_003750 [Endocarpon pusillum]|uniref:DNA-directed RNA polymerase subunit n=1 Tax=Endocarpon pusillum TaxID=364733 RepID=A0A8H7ADV3_9EURO|nr:hypothetical protein GJ744_003750 [Endocarpon pusillum]
MFILTTISDLVRIPPHEFYKVSRDEVEDKINEKYSNKVVQKIGLCICMYDLLKVSDGLIGHGDGFVNVNVEFRLIVFRPFKGEIITGRISSCTEHGIRVSVNFFSDIHVPTSLLFEGSEFIANEQTYAWRPPDAPAESTCYFDVGELVRLRVESEEWHDHAPTGPTQSQKAKERLQQQRDLHRRSGGGQNGDVEISAEMAEEADRRAPYVVIGSMCADGLGGVSWW